MKILIVAEQLEVLDYVRNLGDDPAMQFFQYTHPLKAMDNLEEIQPDIVLWNADDFPRHWKIFVLYARSVFPESTPDIHLVGENALHEEERSKAEALGISGMHAEGFFQDSLARLFSPNRLIGFTGARKPSPSIPHGTGKIVLQHPALHQLLIGELLGADQQGVRAQFFGANKASAFLKNLIIEEAQLRVDGVTVKVKLRVNQADEDGLVDFLILQFM